LLFNDLIFILYLILKCYTELILIIKNYVIFDHKKPWKIQREKKKYIESLLASLFVCKIFDISFSNAKIYCLL